MNSIKNKRELILSLIKDDLTNLKLVYSLNALGLAADHYTLHAGSTVINLMKINATGLQWENIHDGYLERTRKVAQIDIQESPLLLDALAKEIYGYLKAQRKELVSWFIEKRSNFQWKIEGCYIFQQIITMMLYLVLRK